MLRIQLPEPWSSVSHDQHAQAWALFQTLEAWDSSRTECHKICMA